LSADSKAADKKMTKKLRYCPVQIRAILSTDQFSNQFRDCKLKGITSEMKIQRTDF
jgi:hypothetical protein